MSTVFCDLSRLSMCRYRCTCSFLSADLSIVLAESDVMRAPGRQVPRCRSPSHRSRRLHGHHPNVHKAAQVLQLLCNVTVGHREVMGESLVDDSVQEGDDVLFESNVRDGSLQLDVLSRYAPAGDQHS